MLFLYCSPPHGEVGNFKCFRVCGTGRVSLRFAKIQIYFQTTKVFRPNLLHEHEIDGKNEAHESCEMVPMELFALEHDARNDRKHGERDNLLYHL